MGPTVISMRHMLFNAACNEHKRGVGNSSTADEVMLYGGLLSLGCKPAVGLIPCRINVLLSAIRARSVHSGCSTRAPRVRKHGWLPVVPVVRSYSHKAG